MFLGKRKKKFEEKEVEQIIDDYSQTMKNVVGKYLPRKVRRAMNRKGSGAGLTSAEKNEQMEKIKKIGISAWLNEITEDTFGELSSFVSDSVSLQSELYTALKEFKKRWNIR
ncbi:MAG: hypothetical protein U9O41_01820 [Candidatus Aerophobetes bacterium]|nr:hypothetical protein [Candidatus Aerophobetes bacterium]